MPTIKEQAAYEQVSEACVTPERYGYIALSNEIVTENLGGLFDD